MILLAEVEIRETTTPGTKEIKARGEWTYYIQYTKRNNYFESDNSGNYL